MKTFRIGLIAQSVKYRYHNNVNQLMYSPEYRSMCVDWIRCNVRFYISVRREREWVTLQRQRVLLARHLCSYMPPVSNSTAESWHLTSNETPKVWLHLPSQSSENSISATSPVWGFLLNFWLAEHLSYTKIYSYTALFIDDYFLVLNTL